MVLPFILPKLLAEWLLSFSKLPTRKLRRQPSLHRTGSTRFALNSGLYPSATKFSSSLPTNPRDSFICDFQTTLLRSPHSMFPFFMLVAFEGGSPLRALLLLLCYPLISLIGPDEAVSIKIMVFIAFCGLREKDVELVSKAVLPKFYLENLNRYSTEVLMGAAKRRVVVTRMPRVMVEWFLREYLEVGEVVGAELRVKEVFGGGKFYTGLVSSGLGLRERKETLKELFGEKKADLGLVSCRNSRDNLFISYCKEPYIVTRDASGPTSVLPRENYPKPLVFHDGRLAFLPTPSASLSLFLYFPVGLILAFLRISFGIIFPYRVAQILAPLFGLIVKAQNRPQMRNPNGKGVLFVCNHRTLLDPVMLTAVLARPLTAVTYSLSAVSELLAPIRTVRLTRNRQTDASMIEQLLKEGDVVVCPEGTTCREPYLLRFSALFAELADEMVPVAVDTRVSMFYGTTASGYKMLDPLFFLMNPRPVYEMRFLGLVPREFTFAGGMKAVDAANRIQRELAAELGFECTGLTRRDKYLALAGNEGIVNEKKQRKKD